MNTDMIAQAARDFIATNNLRMQAIGQEMNDQYIEGLLAATRQMQDEFLRLVSNATQNHALARCGSDAAISFAQVIYTSATGFDIIVEGP